MLSVLVGANVQIKSTLTDVDTGNPVDPSDVTFYLENPSGTITNYTYSGSQVTRVSAGVYKIVAQLSSTGTWNWSVKGANGQGRDAGIINVVNDPAWSGP